MIRRIKFIQCFTLDQTAEWNNEHNVCEKCFTNYTLEVVLVSFFIAETQYATGTT